MAFQNVTSEKLCLPQSGDIECGSADGAGDLRSGALHQNQDLLCEGALLKVVGADPFNSLKVRHCQHIVIRVGRVIIGRFQQ